MSVLVESARPDATKAGTAIISESTDMSFIVLEERNQREQTSEVGGISVSLLIVVTATRTYCMFDFALVTHQ